MLACMRLSVQTVQLAMVLGTDSELDQTEARPGLQSVPSASERRSSVEQVVNARRQSVRLIARSTTCYYITGP